MLIVTPAEPDVAAAASVALAHCMAEELRHPILLVDASEDGGVSRVLGTPSEAGLTDFLADTRQQIETLALPTNHEQVSFLPLGTRAGTPVSPAPEHLRELLSAARCWDFIVISGGGILSSGLSMALAPDVGKILLLVTENRTQIGDIDAAQRTLSLCHAHDVSLVLTERSGALR